MKKYICTECAYIYHPLMTEDGIENGTPFEDLDESWTCPHCDAPKDSFDEMLLNIQSLSGVSPTEEEDSHTPYYTRRGGKIRIQIGSEDNIHPMEDGHFIEYVGLFDEENEPIEVCAFPTEGVIEFNDEDLDFFQVLSCCNLHGVWQ